MELPDGRDWLWGKLGLILISRVLLIKSLIQFSFDGLGCFPSLLFDMRPSQKKGNEGNGDLLQKVVCMHCCIQWPLPFSRLLSTYFSTRDSWTLTGKPGSVFYQVTAPFFWVLVHTGVFFFFFFFVPSKSLFPQSYVNSVVKSNWPPKSNSLGVFSPFAKSPDWEIYCFLKRS